MAYFIALVSYNPLGQPTIFTEFHKMV